MTAQGIVGEFLSLKEQTDADLLAMQCGDFYEFFADDAEFVGEKLDLKVSQKSSHGSSYPMAGVPLNDLTPYLKALVERGYRVAVADQYETDNGHARKITRVVTPGTLLETTDADARYIAAVVRGDDGYGLAFADATTGKFLVTDTETEADAHAELYRFGPVEILPGPEIRNDDEFLNRLRESSDASLSLHDADSFAPGRAKHALREQFGREALDSVGLNGERAIRAAGAALSYVEETGVGVAQSMTRLQAYRVADHLELDATTQRNLELTETMHGDRSGSLLDTIDHTVTSPGGRLLKEWLTRPRRSQPDIEHRLDSVEALASAALDRERVRDTLDGAYDLERLTSRTASGSAGAHDLLSVRDTLAVLPELREAIDGRLADSPLSDVVARPDHDAAAALHDELDGALAEEPPKTLTQGGLICRGYDDELDELIERHEEANRWIDGLAEREKSRHGLHHLSVSRNKTDGYYIQVGKSQTDGVPDEYREIKTLKNSKRYVTDELEERERDILRLEEVRGELEYELFKELRRRVADHAALLQDVGRTVAEIDALASLATHAAGNDWVRPELTAAGPLRIEAGRHPVVETTTDFVPNDLYLDRERAFLIVTGPNMSGKSTYMRQSALITLLAQVGSFVPARSATVGLVDGIYTRVGALDELAQGRSTFMVEMQELSNILHSATEDSLVILDEVGRGTATYDGISIAWAATEYLHNEVRAKTLFATHYHELTGLADHLDRVENVHVAADETDGDVTFLRTVRDGPTNRSYGIHVAELAGVPDPVVTRATDVLDRLRTEKAIEAKGGGGGEPVQAVFDLQSGQFAAGDGGSADATAADSAGTDEGGETGATSERAVDAAANGAIDSAFLTEYDDPEPVLDALSETNLDELSPIELMAKVQEWQAHLDKER
ncbi:DNA mismatch repair protein MutS [Haloprofundus marisrubri]|uniref:DNA mismatch repair protein MutS n=1 Tax=Haloprofundus marisrubri TaxID=1514971 RepID=A0A0W1RCU4_9EURY|nr:DNA mismatch repair protein MutS [Haloprofundus marisrubri]KTG10921.1 DNA mismatch repair protein MutS [Haloprofundus marisrubri]